MEREERREGENGGLKDSVADLKTRLRKGENGGRAGHVCEEGREGEVRGRDAADR